MFHAVRHWWSEGRGKLTARTFVFELVVVILGVLIAQGLANWVQDRAANERMEEARGRIRRELADNLAYAEAWRAAVPCIDQRLSDIMRGASDGNVPAALVVRPRFPPFITTQMDDQSELLMRRRYGDRNADLLNVLRRDFEAANGPMNAMIAAWGRLGLADVSNGRVSPSDWAQVRLAAADVRASLGSLDNLVGEVRMMARSANVRPFSDDRFRPATHCEEIWANRNVAIFVDRRR